MEGSVLLGLIGHFLQKAISPRYVINLLNIYSKHRDLGKETEEYILNEGTREILRKRTKQNGDT